MLVYINIMVNMLLKIKLNFNNYDYGWYKKKKGRKI